MYDENSFKNYIFWLQVRRIFLMLLFSIIGCALGVVLSQFLTDVLLYEVSKPLVIAISTILSFAISILLTVGTGKEIQEGYWKMAVLRKLTVISKKLDNLENSNTGSKNAYATPSIKEMAENRQATASQNTNQPTQLNGNTEPNETKDINE